MVDIDKTTQLYLNNEVQFFCFGLGVKDQVYGVNIFKIREVIRYDGEITRITNSYTSPLEGLITVRNETIPLVDLRKWFHYDHSHNDINLSEFAIPGEELFVMICDFSDYVVGIRIKEAKRIISRKWSDVNQNSDLGIRTGNPKITANTKYIDNSIVQIVDIERMLVDVFPWIDEGKATELDSLGSIDIPHKEVLLAEDSPSAMKMMQRILDKLNVNHRDFQNGRLLLDYVFSEDTDVGNIGVIITDLEMPEASGFEVIKQLKNFKHTRDIPVVVNSSMSGDSNRNMAKKLNADAFISKSNPIEIQDVLARLLVEN